MGRINTGRVVVGGLLAGLLINISEFVLNTVVIAKDMEAAMMISGSPHTTLMHVGIVGKTCSTRMNIEG